MIKYGYILIAGIAGAIISASAFTYWGGVVPELSHNHDETGGAVHYHANFAVYKDDKFVDFSGDEYMEEVWSCLKGATEQRPLDRVHLHENNGTGIHVHAPAVTWGHFFTNINWSFGENYLVDRNGNVYFSGNPSYTLTSTGLYMDRSIEAPKKGDTRRVRYVLNNELISNPYALKIVSEDTLLVDYSGDADEVVLERAKAIPQEAVILNSKDDPASCSGNQ